MKISIVVGSYIIYTALHFIVAFIFFESDVDKGQNVIMQLLGSLGNAFYWFKVIAFYLLLLFISSLVGMYLTRSNRPVFRLFMGICIGSLLLSLIAVVSSYF